MSADVQALSDVLLAAALCFWIFCFVNTSRLGARRMPGMINMTVVELYLSLSLTLNCLSQQLLTHMHTHTCTQMHVWTHIAHIHIFMSTQGDSVYSWYQKNMASMTMCKNGCLFQANP